MSASQNKDSHSQGLHWLLKKPQLLRQSWSPDDIPKYSCLANEIRSWVSVFTECSLGTTRRMSCIILNSLQNTIPPAWVCIQELLPVPYTFTSVEHSKFTWQRREISQTFHVLMLLNTERRLKTEYIPCQFGLHPNSTQEISEAKLITSILAGVPSSKRIWMNTCR